MSTITASPVPSFGRKSVVIGLAVLGAVTVGAVTIPRSHTTATTSTPTVSRAQAPDSLERRDAMLAAQHAKAAQEAQAQEKVLDHYGKLNAQHPGTTAQSPANPLGASVAQQQVGGMHQTYTYDGSKPRVQLRRQPID